MLIETADFNNAGEVIKEFSELEWNELREVFLEMPLHIKASDQAGLQGNPIFDPVGTNSYIKNQLIARGWGANIVIPKEYKFMGTDVDFSKNNILLEVQFSNYPFLLNNILRSELFFQGNIQFTNKKIRSIIIVTKGHMFPASNSTLYYEQAKNQLEALANNNVFDVPIRLVGLLERFSNNIEAIRTTYENPRYSRTVVLKERITCSIQHGATERSRAIIVI